MASSNRFNKAPPPVNIIPVSTISAANSGGTNSNDLLIGISCSGAAKYVISALEYAKKKSAKTVYLITNPAPYLSTSVDKVIAVDTGTEIVAGSTRMKAGTATKMILNMISTTTMISMGKVYGNLMVDLMAVNEKLVDRGARIIKKITGESELINTKKLIYKKII